MRVLLTGSCGRIGRVLTPAFAERYELRTFDRIEEPGDSPDHRVGDLTDPDALADACAGIEVVVHLAATPQEADFLEELVPNNVVGLYRTFEAVREAGVRRMVFASTVQTILGHPRDGHVSLEDRIRPCSLYGATKAFGEHVGSWYHDQHGLEFVAVRIGAFRRDVERAFEYRLESDRPSTIWFVAADAIDLFTSAVEKPDLGFAVVFGASKNEHQFMDPGPAREVLGFEPSFDVGRAFGEFVARTKAP